MADSTQNSGFTLPTPQPLPAPGAPAPAAPGPAPLPAIPSVPSAPFSVQFPSINLNMGPQPRDYAIGGGVMLVLLIAFFFIRGGYANYLAGKRVPPGAANAAGWFLFVFLTALALVVVLTILGGKLAGLLVIIPLGLIALVSLILMFLSGRR